MNQHIQDWCVFLVAAITIIRKVIKDDLVSFYLWPILEWMFKLMIHLKHFHSDWSHLNHFWSVWFCWNHQQSSWHRCISVLNVFKGKTGYSSFKNAVDASTPSTHFTSSIENSWVVISQCKGKVLIRGLKRHQLRIKVLNFLLKLDICESS